MVILSAPLPSPLKHVLVVMLSAADERRHTEKCRNIMRRVGKGEKREEKNGEVGEETAQPSDIKQTVGSLKICQKEISAG